MRRDWAWRLVWPAALALCALFWAVAAHLLLTPALRDAAADLAIDGWGEIGWAGPAEIPANEAWEDR